MFIFLPLLAILARSPSSTYTCLVKFSVGADTPLSLDLSAGRTQPLAVVLHPFCYFSGTFIATVSHIHTGLKFFQTYSQLFPASPGLLLVNKWPPHVSHWTSILLPPPNPIQSLHSIASHHRGSWGQPRPVIVSEPHVRYAKYQVGGQ